MDRLEAFERMLADIKKQADEENRKMAELKAAGREKSATYRQYFSNRMLYRMILDRYRQYGLLDRDGEEEN
jgi:muconolactone delta-isomerase